MGCKKKKKKISGTGYSILKEKNTKLFLKSMGQLFLKMHLNWWFLHNHLPYILWKSFSSHDFSSAIFPLELSNLSRFFISFHWQFQQKNWVATNLDNLEKLENWKFFKKIMGKLGIYKENDQVREMLGNAKACIFQTF